MDIINFLQELSKQKIIERDFVTVVYNIDEEISGTLVPYSEIVSWEGDIQSRIVHPKQGGLISVKTFPDGVGPDVGKPILIETIISITK